MKQTVKVGIIGDFNADNRSHTATNEAINHAAQALGISVEVRWLPTVSLEEQPASTLELFDALWCSPGSPYQSMAGALQAIRFAREQDYPFVGT
jgi:CTP synthase (UTP-ammonia lyase)